MFRREFKKWLKVQGITFNDYLFLEDEERLKINAAYIKENIELNKRYSVKELESRFPSVCVEMADIAEKRGKIISGVVVKIFPDTYSAEQRYWELFIVPEQNYVVGIA